MRKRIRDDDLLKIKEIADKEIERRQLNDSRTTFTNKISKR